MAQHPKVYGIFSIKPIFGAFWRYRRRPSRTWQTVRGLATPADELVNLVLQMSKGSLRGDIGPYKGYMGLRVGSVLGFVFPMGP